MHLFPVPREVIAFFPYYRSYSYFVVGDEICIVDPGTYQVVDVIDEGYWGAPGHQVAGLRLSSGQIALIRDSIPRDFPEANMTGGRGVSASKSSSLKPGKSGPSLA